MKIPSLGKFLPLSAVALLASAVTLPAQPFPDKPAANTNNVTDRNQMLWQVGYTIPTFPPRLQDPNRPANAWPTNVNNPDGANWTDALNHTINRGGIGGLWVTYDDGTPSGAYGYGQGDTPEIDGWQYTPIDLLKMNDGTPVTTAEDWWTKRRPEILQDAQEQLYGLIPDKSLWPAITWVFGDWTEGTANGVAYSQRTVTGNIDTSSYPALRNAPRISATIRIPAAARAAGTKVPAIIVFGGTGPWQYVAPKGWGVIGFTPTTVQPDSGGANLSSYLIGLINQGNWRKPSDWGALGAWSWGVSRLIDVMAEPPQYLGVDTRRLGVQGHSRYGKGAIVAMAFDQRILTAYPSSSGALGAHMNRRHWGQNVENVGGDAEYHWMAGNFYNYMGPLTPGTYKPRRLENLRVDGHSMVALAAPRGVFINGGGDGDAWQDPRGMFLAGLNANPVYELLGRKGLVIPPGTPFTSGPGESIGGTPPFGQAFIEGHVGFRRQTEGHVDAPGWPAYVEFSAKFFDDNTAPTLSLPADLIVEATSPAGAVVTFSATASDASDDNVPVSFSHASGSTFPIGTTTVTASATDISGNTATGYFLVAVADTTAPVITSVPAKQVVDATSPAGAAVTYPAATATDAASTPTLTYSKASGSVFVIGTTNVLVTATDASGNFSTSTFQVEVLGAVPQLNNLMSDLWGMSITAPVKILLEVPLVAAQLGLRINQPQAATRALTTFEELVRTTLKTKRITAAQADELLAASQRLRATIGN